MQKVRLDASWTEARVVSFQKYDAHYIVADVPFSLKLRGRAEKIFQLNSRHVLSFKIFFHRVKRKIQVKVKN